MKPTNNKPHSCTWSFLAPPQYTLAAKDNQAFEESLPYESETKTRKQIIGNLEKRDIIQGTDKKNKSQNKNFSILYDKLLHPFEKKRMPWKIKIIR